jgi:hypothetical protein
MKREAESINGRLCDKESKLIQRVEVFNHSGAQSTVHQIKQGYFGFNFFAASFIFMTRCPFWLRHLSDNSA